MQPGGISFTSSDPCEEGVRLLVLCDGLLIKTKEQDILVLSADL